MTATKTKTWLSGHCNPSNPIEIHRQCDEHPRADGVPCSCLHHMEPSQPGGLSSTEGEQDGQHTRAHLDQVGRVAEGSDRGGIRTGSGASDRAGLDPTRVGSGADLAERRLSDSGWPEGSATHPGARVLITEHAELVDVEYLSPDWYEVRRHGIAASEIAAVLGISPWTSPFDLWWFKQSGEASEKENRAMRRGRRYEALVLEDFADEHPEFDIRPGLMVRNLDRPWQMATLDGLAYDSPNSTSPLAPVEAKTGQRNEWGDPGTDNIPVHYRCQVLWQMDVLGLSVAYIPVRFGDQYEEYVVEYDPTDVQLMRDAAVRFVASLEANEQPEIDSHIATGRRLKHMHRDLEDREVDVPLTIVRQYQAAQRLKKAAEDRMRLADNRVRHLVGNASTAVLTTPDGRRTFSHTVSDIKERTQVVGAHQQNRINYPRKAV